MLRIEIPGRGYYELEHLVLDMNGTLATDGIIPGSVLERMVLLSMLIDIHLVTADTHGRLESQKERLPVKIERVAPPAEVAQKAAFVERLGAERSIAIGNGSNDVEMLRMARLAIVVMGAEGCSVEALTAADIAVNSAENALDLLLNPNRLIATLRK